MKRILLRPAALAFLTSGLLLASCNSKPAETEPDKTATVIPKETNAASDSAATTVKADSSSGGSTTSGK